MELPNEVKIEIVRGRIESVVREQYGLTIDHEVQTLINGPRLQEIEEGLAACIKALRALNARLDALTSLRTNGSEKEHVSVNVDHSQ